MMGSYGSDSRLRFSLGAQRRAFGKNDLPQVQTELAAYVQALRSKTSTESILSLTSPCTDRPQRRDRC